MLTAHTRPAGHGAHAAGVARDDNPSTEAEEADSWFAGWDSFDPDDKPRPDARVVNASPA